jgi:iron complex outermembrane receptor protein
MRVTVTATAICGSILALASAQDAAALMRKPTDIPAEGLTAALAALAREFDFQVLYRTEVVGALRTQGAAGTFTPGEALERVLSGTGLTYEYLDEKTVTIVPEPPPTQPATPSSQSLGTRESPLRLAQTESATDASPPAATSPDALEEIVVTAQKRAEKLQEVPISISVLSGAQLEQQQVTSLNDLSRVVPDMANTTANLGPGQGNYEIRGVSGSVSQTSIAQATVGIYLDDVSMTVPTGAGVGSTELKFFDIDRIEVLRGPQGTLYGASSMGGTIRFISNQPDLNTFEGSASTELSDTKHGSLNYVDQGILNLPLSSGVLAARIGVQYSQQSGYIDVENPDALGQVTSRDLNDDRATVVRATLKYQSPDSDLTILPAVLVQRETFGGFPQYDPATPLQTPLYATPQSFDNSLIASLTIQKSLFGASLTSASSYFQRKSNLEQDGTINLEAPLTANTLYWPSVFQLPNNLYQYSEELRLASKSMQESGLPLSGACQGTCRHAEVRAPL